MMFVNHEFSKLLFVPSSIPHLIRHWINSIEFYNTYFLLIVLKYQVFDYEYKG
ncbi:hypothetical protein HMPREF0742_02312 [Rothia aeria F0184]|uniref:Uncharacterized protein n=1 Tax=Rothia aeria F0184 TaxID=888019 RepID=U7UYK9_9MICC|nr:hypothetical protein HMPREF0742_02312 [Rothia aeria F0184]